MSHHLGPLPVLSGVFGSTTPDNPIVPTSYRQLPMSGAPMFVTRDGPVHWAPQQWMAQGLCNSPGVAIMGPKNCGKSSIGKAAALYDLATRSRHGDLDSSNRRVWVDDSKDHEWRSLTRAVPRTFDQNGQVATFCEPFEIANASLSPLDPRQSADEQVLIIRLILSQQTGDESVSKYNTMALMAAVGHLKTEKTDVYPSLHAVAELLNNPPAELRPPPLFAGSDQRVNFESREVFLGYCHDTALMLHQLLSSPFGRTFGSGDRGSMFDELDQPITTIDYAQASEEVNTVVHMIAWLYKKSIMGVDASWFDEAWGLLKNPFFAHQLRETLKFIRARSQFVGFNLHRPHDLLAISDPAAAEAAIGILKDSPVWLVGQQDPDDAKFIQEHWAGKNCGCSDAIRREIEWMPKHQFYLFMEGLDSPLRVKAVFPPNVLKLTFTNQALHSATGKEVL